MARGPAGAAWLVVVATALALLAAAAPAAKPRAALQQVEASMVIEGTVDIGRDGAPVAHALDQADRIPPYVTALVARAIPELRFMPVLVAGEPVVARAKMRMRLVAKPGEDGDMRMAIRAVDFGEGAYAPEGGRAADDTGTVRAKAMAPPKFPTDVLDIGGKGTVYLIVKVGRQGQVLDVATEQVNLTALGNAFQMAQIRNSLARAATFAARQWTFLPPTTGDSVDSESWVVRVPIDFAYPDDPKPGYGEWSSYVPGPWTRVPWAIQENAGFSPDLVPTGAVRTADATPRFRLLTPIGEG